MSITNDVLIACSDETRRGGVKRIFVVPACEVTSFTAGASHEYTAVVLTALQKFFEIEGEFETKPFTAEGSTENGSNVTENTLEVFVPKMEKTKAKELNDLFAGGKVVVVFSVYDVVYFACKCRYFGGLIYFQHAVNNPQLISFMCSKPSVPG